MEYLEKIFKTDFWKTNLTKSYTLKKKCNQKKSLKPQLYLEECVLE